MRLALGTAQLGTSYGVTNLRGELSDADSKNVLVAAEKAGISLLDTAPAYGNAERRIGRHSGFSVVTKLNRVGEGSVQAVLDRFQESLKTLNREGVYGLLAHEASDFVDHPELFTRVLELKELGLVKKIGVSVYSPKELKKILERCRVDLVQLPINVFNQDFVEMLDELKDLEIEVHARSIFLQGLLLAENLPLGFEKHEASFREFDFYAKGCRRTKADICFSFLRSLGAIDFALVGVTSVEELNHLVNEFEKSQHKSRNLSFKGFKSKDHALTNPANW